VGHAVETACGYTKYNHGEAVALGMRAACRMSVAGKLLSPRDALRIEMLLSQIGLPQTIEGVPKVVGPKIMNAMKFDKKFDGRRSRFVLAKGIGRVAIVDDVPVEFVKAIVSGLMA
jgi:3-dehydroquinate synthase